MKYFLTLFTVYFISFNTKGQIEKEPLPDNDMPVLTINSQNGVYGKILDHDTRKPIAAVSVQLIASVNNRLTNEKKDSVIAAMLSAPNGDFSFENIHSFDSLRLQLSAVGYNIYVDNFAFANVNGDSTTPIEHDLGNILMSHIAKTLEDVTIVLSKPALQWVLIKRYSTLIRAFLQREERLSM